jgi:dinuclear metal center YbgI/SA1388 family protein
MRVRDLVDAMHAIAPLDAAESWDRVGLQVGDPQRELAGPVLLTIDLTEPVLGEAIGEKASAIVAYHPPIWTALSSLSTRTPAERIVRGAIEAGIAIYSPHTALDAARGGLTEWLCEGLSQPEGKAAAAKIAGDCRALVPQIRREAEREVKIVTFVPEDAVDRVRAALGTAGAGGIGRYRLCSFSAPGTGTFLPQDGANPTIGAVGRLEKVAEHRLEMVCSRAALPLAIETLREFHPYEEPAFDVIELVGEPERRVGAGRRLVLDQPATVRELAQRFGAFLNTPRVRYALAFDDEPVQTIGVVAGAGESMLDTAIREGCRVFVTGEMKHHEIVRALHAGVSVIVAGHTNTERGFLPRLAGRLEERLPSVSFVVSRLDRDPLVRLG